MNKKFIFFGISVIIIISTLYCFFCFLELRRVVQPINEEKYELANYSGEELDQRRITNQEWYFWDEKSYVDIELPKEGKYIDFNLKACGFKTLYTKLIFYSEENEIQQEVRMQVNDRNLVAIPEDGDYSKCRAYMIQPSEEFADDLLVNTKGAVTAYLQFDSISIKSELGINYRIILNTLLCCFMASTLSWILIFNKGKWWCESMTSMKYMLGIIICFITLFYIKTFYFPFDGITYFGDAGIYYSLGNTFLKDGKFSLLNYLHTEADFSWMFRGYFLPLLIWVFKLPGHFIGGTDLFYDINSCLFFSVFFVVGIPKLFEVLFKVKISLIQIMATVILILVFWRGVIFYPFSDLYGTVFSVYAVLFFAYFVRHKQKKYLLLNGLCLAVAYEIRNANVILISMEFLVLMFYDKKIISKIMNYLVFLVGLFIVMLPQYILNSNLIGVNSFLIQTVILGGDKSLFLMQIEYGLEFSRREIELVSGNTYQGRNFENLASSKLIVEYGEINTWGDYIKLVLKEPLNIIGFYVNKLLLVLDLRFQNIINTELAAISTPLFTICNIVLWITGLLGGGVKMYKGFYI